MFQISDGMRSLVFSIFFFPGLLFSQNLREDWRHSLGSSATLHAVLEATNGYIVSVGETTSKTAGGTDGLLLLTDHSTGQVVAELRFGGPKDDVLYAVAQTHDGRFLLAGASESGSKGGRDAWLVLVDERGRKVWETTFGTPGHDECRKLRILPDGAALLAGHQNDKKSGDIWLAKVNGKQLAWEKNLGTAEFETVSGLVFAPDGGYVFCGNTGKKGGTGKGDVFLVKTDPRGELLWKKWFGEDGWDEALDLVAAHDGGFALAGLKSGKAGDTDCWLLKTSRDGFKQWEKSFGGKSADAANALLQTTDGGFLLAGHSRSKRSGARSPDAFLVQTTHGGELQWEKYLGDDRDDAIAVLCPLHNGSFTAAGSFDGDEATLFRFSDPQNTQLAAIAMRDAASVEISEAIVRSSDGTLVPGERGYLAFRVSNKSDLDLHDLRVTADNPSANGHLSAWSTNYLGILRKNAGIEVRIPLQAATDLGDGEQRLTFAVSSGEKSLKSFEKNIRLRKPKPATLLVAQHNFAASDRSDEVTLAVQIENSGDTVSRAVEVRFVCPEGLKTGGATIMLLGPLAPHDRREVKLTFTKTPQFTAPVAAIACAVLEGGTEKVRKTFEWQAGGKTSILATGPILIWTDPAPHETGSNKLRVAEDHFEFKMTVVSGKPLDTKNFKMKLNGTETEGAKFNEEDLSPPKRENTQYTYTYHNKIPLQQGKNRVEVVVDGQVSDYIEVEFAPERANLFVLAIGPTHDDLKYTAKDAADFAAAFAGQAGKLYSQVFVSVLNAPEKTDLTGIKQAAFDLAYQWDDKQIKPTDVLLVFISSHGKIVDNRFKLLQTGYNPKYERLAVDFKSDVLEVLSPINCKKVVFLDACHSGGAKDGYGGLSRAVVELAKTQPGVTTLTSCGSTEKSYEDKAWANGAFTEALLEAFANTECHDASGAYRADANGDQAVRLGELYDFLRRRVPSLVQNTIPNAPTGQMPFMPESQLDKEMPIYWLGGDK
ncbi:MAG: caspase family protein [Saprospiraceae bacterium]